MEYEIWLMLAIPFVGFLLWEGYSLWLDTRPNRMKGVFLDAGKNVVNRRVKLNGDGKSFNTKVGGIDQKYSVTEDCVYRTGRWRVPTSYYNVGQSTPINIRDVKAENPISAQDFFIATESNIGRQIIEKFESSLITITSSMMVLIIVIAIANAFVYMQLNTSLTVIQEALGIVPIDK